MNNTNPNYDYDEDWYCEFRMGIHDVKSLYSVVCYSLEMWPGSPARPAEEQEYLHMIRKQLFAMLADYTFTHIEAQE